MAHPGITIPFRTLRQVARLRLGPTRCPCTPRLQPNIVHVSRASQRRWNTTSKPKSEPRGSSKSKFSNSSTVRLIASSGGLASGLLLTYAVTADSPKPKEPDDSAKDNRDPSLPRYRLSQVRTHNASSDRPWVTYEDKVYDITDWIPAHPGGDVILRAAGGSIDRFWDIFSIHKSAYVREILDQFQIGLIDAADLVNGQPALDDVQDPFVHDPQRHPELIRHTEKPCNAETPTHALESYITPNSLFYVRNHMWVPQVDETKADDDHTVTVELMDGSTRTYTVHELKTKFKPYKVTATLQCSGNRRRDMSTYAGKGKTNGLPWDVGAISNAEWEGARLCDVLADAGMPPRHDSSDPSAASKGNDAGDEAQHVHFAGMEAYGSSIPIAKAIDPRGDVLLAYSMNGKPLPRDHGFPLRALVPGHVAARSVKWLSRIGLSDEESPSQWQRRDYKCFGPNIGKNPDWDSAPAIQEMPITSAVTSVVLADRFAGESKPTITQKSEEKKMTEDDKEKKRTSSTKSVVRGYAYSGGGREIVRVDVSVDGGKTWGQARLLDGGSAARGSKSWAWRRWVYDVDVEYQATTTSHNKGRRCADFVAKATDEAYNTQPTSHAGIYNARGNLATAWHKYRACLLPESEGAVTRVMEDIPKAQAGPGEIKTTT